MIFNASLFFFYYDWIIGFLLVFDGNFFFLGSAREVLVLDYFFFYGG